MHAIVQGLWVKPGNSLMEVPESPISLDDLSDRFTWVWRDLWRAGEFFFLWGTDILMPFYFTVASFFFTCGASVPCLPAAKNWPPPVSQAQAALAPLLTKLPVAIATAEDNYAAQFGGSSGETFSGVRSNSGFILQIGPFLNCSVLTNIIVPRQL